MWKSAEVCDVTQKAVCARAYIYIYIYMYMYIFAGLTTAERVASLVAMLNDVHSTVSNPATKITLFNYC